MTYTILDCYTDEPAGLGVPPYLGTYPRYLYGALGDAYYLTIDDVRLWKRYASKKPDKGREVKTNTKVYNLTRNYADVGKILQKTKTLIVIVGVQTPGKYLSAVPGTLPEIYDLIKDLPCRKVMTGPVAIGGTRLEGGKGVEKADMSLFDEVDFNYLGINEYAKINEYAVKGASILDQIPYPVVLEIETGKGCDIGHCSFCTEPLKNRVLYRDKKPVFEEIAALRKKGALYFRLGKQTCFYSYLHGNVAEIESLLKGVAALKPKMLHIDNVNPVKVVGSRGIEITKLVVQYCTPGNIAAFGVESFDEEVVKANTLNTYPDVAYKAAQIINQYGKERGWNGMPKFLPGINLIFGLMKESKKTFEENMRWLTRFLEEDLWLRRINIRQVVPFEGTRLYEEAGTKYVKKNKRHYWSWRRKIREAIDYPMLKKVVPAGTILREVRTEIYDGKTTFARQMGSYPLIVGIKGRLPLDTFYDIRVTDHMLRSITGEVAQKETA